jgi:hypothetical protein
VNAKKIQSKARRKKEERLQDIVNQLKQEFESEKQKKTLELQEQLQERLGIIGAGHNVEDKENYGQEKVISEEDKQKEALRYKAAISKVLRERKNEENIRIQQEEYRKSIALIEKCRKEMILSQPLPTTDPIQKLEPVKVMNNTTVTTAKSSMDSFSKTRYHLETFLTRYNTEPALVEIATEDEQVDANEAAKELEEINAEIKEHVK